MAKAPTVQAPEAPVYEPETIYAVRLKKPATIFGLPFLPLHDHEMTGAFLTSLIAENGDVVDTADAR